MPDEDEAKEKRTDDIPQWDQNFLQVDQPILFDLILVSIKLKWNEMFLITMFYLLLIFKAANYLDIKGLLDLCCKTVANMIKGKTPEEIRKTFNIKNDFSPAEEEQIRKENEWCEEKWFFSKMYKFNKNLPSWNIKSVTSNFL